MKINNVRPCFQCKHYVRKHAKFNMITDSTSDDFDGVFHMCMIKFHVFARQDRYQDTIELGWYEFHPSENQFNKQGWSFNPTLRLDIPSECPFILEHTVESIE